VDLDNISAPQRKKDTLKYDDSLGSLSSSEVKKELSEPQTDKKESEHKLEYIGPTGTEDQGESKFELYKRM